MIYISLLIGMWVTSPLVQKTAKIGRKYRGDKIYVVSWGVILLALVAFRSKDVGRDTVMYEIIFQRAEGSVSLNGFLHEYVSTEYGYHILEYIVSRFAGYRTFIVIIACISIIPVLFVISKYSDDKPLSMILYLCFPYYTFCMSAMRQAAAMGCIAIAYYFVKEKKTICFIITCFVAYCFHSSAMLFLPIYWLDKIPYKQWTRIAAIATMVIAYIFRTTLWSIATLFARQQYFSNKAGGQKMYLFMILSVILGFIFRKKFVENEKNSNKILLYLQMLSVMIWPMASINSATFRMYYYYHMFIILYVPIVLKSILSKDTRIVVKYGFVFVGVYFLCSQILPVQQGYNPYAFFWQ